MKSINLGILLASVSAVTFTGCATSSSRPIYQSSQVGQMITEEQGEILDVREVLIQAPHSQAGSAGVGSRMGGAIAAAAVLGSPIQAAMEGARVVGGIAGANADNKNGEELTIRLKDGRTVVVVQQRGDTPFAIGEKVKIQSGSSTSIYGGGNTRVVHDDTVYAKSF
jgi:outer membrane lipoprotein SlyB